MVNTHKYTIQWAVEKELCYKKQSCIKGIKRADTDDQKC